MTGNSTSKMERDTVNLSELEFHVLCCLGTPSGPSYCYQIAQRLTERLDKRVRGGTLSKIFDRFEQRGWITIEAGVQYAGGPRRHGRLTALGRELLEGACELMGRRADALYQSLWSVPGGLSRRSQG